MVLNHCPIWPDDVHKPFRLCPPTSPVDSYFVCYCMFQLEPNCFSEYKVSWVFPPIFYDSDFRERQIYMAHVFPRIMIVHKRSCTPSALPNHTEHKVSSLRVCSHRVFLCGSPAHCFQWESRIFLRCGMKSTMQNKKSSTGVNCLGEIII